MSVPAWRNTTQWILDDNRSSPVPIGFDFWYDGIRYTSVSVSTNGFLDFSSSSADGTIGVDQTGRDYDSQNSRMSSTSGLRTWNALAPFYDNLTTQNEIDPLGTSIKYLTSGIAPDRVCTIEWINMSVRNFAGQGTGLNFQVKLYESTGTIEYVYGTMNAGAAAYSATVAFNAPDLSGGLTTAVLRAQQTIDTPTFTATPQNALATVPQSNTKLTFTPPVPSAPSELTFSNVTQTSMRVHWMDNAANEVGYSISLSNDGTNFFVALQKTAHPGTGTDSVDLTGLIAGIPYHVRVQAVTEGCLSTVLSGMQVTSLPGVDTTAQSGLWSVPATWRSGIVPGPATNVIVRDEDTVTVDANFKINSLQVGRGSGGVLRIGNNAVERIDTVLGDVRINSGAVLEVNSLSNTGNHVLALSGDLQNNGTFDLAPDADSKCRIVFFRDGTQTISGSGPVNRFWRMTVDLGTSSDHLLDIFPSVFTPDLPGFLTLSRGTVRFSLPGTYVPFAGNAQVPATAGLWLNHPSLTLTTNDSLTVAGRLRVSSGILNVGTAANQRLISEGGTFIFEGGSTNVAGSFGAKDTTSITQFSMNGGSLLAAVIGSTWTQSRFAPFAMTVPGSSFSMSGGTIALVREGGTGVQHLGYINTGSTTSSVTGGVIQLGNANTPEGHTIGIHSTIPVWDLIISGHGNGMITRDLTVRNDVSAADTLFGSNCTITVGGDWTNNGVFVADRSTVVFNGTGTQMIARAGGETFNNLTIDALGTVTRNAGITIDSACELNSGKLDIGGDVLTLNGDISGSGLLLSDAGGTVRYTQPTAGQSIFPAHYGNLVFTSQAKILPVGGVIGIAGSFDPGASSTHIVAGSLVEFNGAAPQSIPRFDFHHLRFAGIGTKTVSATDTVRGSFTITPEASVEFQSPLFVQGDIVQNGAVSGASAMVLSGGAKAHLVSGNASYHRLTLNDAAGASLAGTLLITDNLQLITGVLHTGLDTVRIGSSGAVTRTSGHINGWLQKAILPGTGRNVRFEIGDAAGYAPMEFWFGTVDAGGTIVARDTSAEHPAISASFLDPSNVVHRYWEVRSGDGFAFTPGSGDSVRLTFIPGDQDIAGSWPLYRINLFNGSSWDSLTAGGRTATTTTGRGYTTLGGFAVGVQKSDGAFRSRQSGAWNVASTWERLTGSIWNPAGAPPTSADGVITIESGHAVTVTTNITIDQTVVRPGGTLLVGAGAVTLTLGNGSGTDLTVQGTFRNASNNNIAGTGSMTVTAGGRYEHARHGGNIPIAAWNPASTCAVIGGAAAGNGVPGNLNQTFGNFEWNYPTQNRVLALAGLPATIAGSFTVVTTNGNILRLFSADGQTRTVEGDMVITGGVVVGFPSIGGTNSATLNIMKNLVMSGGEFRLTDGGNESLTANIYDSLKLTGGILNLSNANAIGRMNVEKSVLHTGGSITETAGGSGAFTFSGTEVREYRGGGIVSNTINWTVAPAATLLLNADTLGGTGTFTLSAGATLGIGSAAGITSAGASGNIQSAGTRTFSTAANYLYNGTSAQVTGDGLPATVNRLTIDNAAGVGLTSSVQVIDSLQLQHGVFSIGAATLTIANSASVDAGALTSAVNGTVVYNRPANGQRVLCAQYGNLTFNNAVKMIASGDTVSIAGTFNPGTGSGHSISGSLFDFNGDAQIIPAFRFSDLRISGAGRKSLGARDTVLGQLEIASGIFNDSTFTLLVNGSIRNAALHTGEGRIRLAGGRSVPTISGGGSFTSIELDNGALGVRIGSVLTITGELILTTGVIDAGTDTVIIGPTGYVTRPVNGGHVNGFIRRRVPANLLPQTVVFPVGDAFLYAPVALTFGAVTTSGTVAVRTTSGEAAELRNAGIDPQRSVNRTWTFVRDGIQYAWVDATFNFNPADIDAGANTAAFIVRSNISGTWRAPSGLLRTTTSTKAVNLAGFGLNAIGESSALVYWTGAAGTRSWKNGMNWTSLAVPAFGSSIVLNGPNAIDVDTMAQAQNIVMANDTLVLRVLNGATLATADSLRMLSGTLRIEAAQFDSIGVMAIEGGSVVYSGSVSQTVHAYPYRTLVFEGPGVKSAAGDFSIADTLRIASGAVFNDSLSLVTISGNIVNAGTHTGAGRILVTGGSGPHRISGGGTFGGLEINVPGGVNMIGSRTAVAGTLTLTAGNIVLGASDTLVLMAGSSVARTAGAIDGPLARSIPMGASDLLYPTASSSTYLPVRLHFADVTSPGFVTLGRSTGEHPNAGQASPAIDTSANVNAWWRLVNNGVVLGGPFTATVTFRNPGEVDGGTNPAAGDFTAAEWNGAAWTEQTVAQRWADSTRIVGLTSFGDLILGKLLASLITASQNGLWNDPATWGGRMPGPNDTVVVDNPFTVSLNSNVSIVKLIVRAGGTFHDSTFALTLTGDLVLNGSWRGGGRIVLSTANDTIYGSGVMNGMSTLEIAGSRIIHPTANLVLGRVMIQASDTLRNLGTAVVSDVTGPDASAAWINAPNGTLSITGGGFTAAGLDASSCPNTIAYTGAMAQDILPTTYCTLLIGNAGTKTAGANILVRSSLTVGSGSFLTINPAVTVQVLGPVTTAGVVTNSGHLMIAD